MPKEEFIDYYNRVKEYISSLERTKSNLKKSINREFQQGYIREKRGIVKKGLEEGLKLIYKIRRKYRCIGVVDEKLKEKKNLLKVIAKEIFKLLKNKERAETENELQDFFIEILFGEIMGEVYKYKEARGLPELGEIKTHTTVRDFIATVKGYYDTLNPDGDN
jgi:hypothetical protein